MLQPALSRIRRVSIDDAPCEFFEPCAEFACVESELQFHRGRRCAVWGVEGPGEVEKDDDSGWARERNQGVVESVERDAGSGDG